MHLNSNDPLALTMGCPVGIGPEIILQMFHEGAFAGLTCPPVIVGVPAVFQRLLQARQWSHRLALWQPGRPLNAKVLNMYCPPELEEINQNLPELTWGAPNQLTGKMMGVSIASAAGLAQQGIVSALVTCPITKSALNLAGFAFPGHTEMLASLCRTKDFAMMMAGDKLRVTLVTIHESIRRVPELLDVDRIYKLILQTATSLQVDFAVEKPRIAVSALNPHAGEGGLFGREEDDSLVPALRRAQEAGWDVTGPFPPDTVFYKACHGAYDAVVCMYHDQGLIPFKLLHFDDGVNVTLGLPIVRTSVDHGTAYDIAGRGVASYKSLAAACHMAQEIAAHRKKEHSYVRR